MFNHLCKAYDEMSSELVFLQKKMNVTFSGLFTVPYFCRSFSINLSMGDNTCLR